MDALLRALISDSVSSTTAAIVDVLGDNWVTVTLVVMGIAALATFTFWIIPFKKRKF